MAGADAVTFHIKISPLVVMNIADHYTRSQAQDNQVHVFGALLGTQTGRDVRICDSFEIAVDTSVDGALSLKLDLFEADVALYREAFPQFETLGWYTTTTSAELGSETKQKHQLMTKYNESPLLLTLNPDFDESKAQELPITCYEEIVHVVGEARTSDFVKTPYKVDADEAELVTIENNMTTISNSDRGAVVPHTESLKKSIRALQDRLVLIQRYLTDTQAGKIPKDQQILRGIKGLCHRIPVMQNGEFQRKFLTEYNDALLVSLLANITKGLHVVHEQSSGTPGKASKHEFAERVGGDPFSFMGGHEPELY